MSEIQVNSDLGASRQRPARASDLSFQLKMDLKATWALIDIQTLKASPPAASLHPIPSRRPSIQAVRSLTGQSPKGPPEA